MSSSANDDEEMNHQQAGIYMCLRIDIGKSNASTDWLCHQ